MRKKDAAPVNPVPTAKQTDVPARLNLPGFIRDDVGLGDAVASVTRSLGIPSCGGCARRAQWLNRWVSFRGRGF